MKYMIWTCMFCFFQIFGLAQGEFEKINISDDLELIRLSEDVYIHVSQSDFPPFGRVSSNGLVFINGGDAFLFDTPSTESATIKLVSWLTDTMHLKITGFVPNHWHDDCMGGLAYLQKLKIKSYACQKTIDIAKTKNLPLPAHGFQDSLLLKLGNKEILCYYPGAAHTTDNIVVWIPSEKTLFAGCMIKSLDMKTLGNVADGSLQEYPKTIEQVLRKFPDAKIIIPGHGAFGGPELVLHTLQLLK